jgi:hypothetical protein
MVSAIILSIPSGVVRLKPDTAGAATVGFGSGGVRLQPDEPVLRQATIISMSRSGIRR